MTFFFQVAFPSDTVWNGNTLAMFACTSCLDTKRMVPLRPPNFNTQSYDLPDNYLDEYQTNFRMIVFKSNEPCVVREDIPANILFERVSFEPFDPKKVSAKSKIGGRAAWSYQNDTPKSYMGSKVVFLMQLEWDIELTRAPGAPVQVRPVVFPDSYKLFYGLPTFFMGTTRLEKPQAYVLTQG